VNAGSVTSGAFATPGASATASASAQVSTVSIFGGTAEYIALWFKSIGMETGYYWYVTACIAVSLLVYITMKDTRKHSRIETD